MAKEEWRPPTLQFLGVLSDKNLELVRGADNKAEELKQVLSEINQHRPRSYRYGTHG